MRARSIVVYHTYGRSILAWSFNWTVKTSVLAHTLINMCIESGSFESHLMGLLFNSFQNCLDIDASMMLRAGHECLFCLVSYLLNGTNQPVHTFCTSCIFKFNFVQFNVTHSTYSINCMRNSNSSLSQWVFQRINEISLVYRYFCSEICWRFWEFFVWSNGFQMFFPKHFSKIVAHCLLLMFAQFAYMSFF